MSKSFQIYHILTHYQILHDKKSIMWYNKKVPT
jgi:hypothetical protein